MMEIKKFQECLDRLMELGESQGKQLKQKDIEQCFGRDALSGQQLDSLYEYLWMQGIRVELGKHMPDAAVREKRDASDPLNQEEERWLHAYRESLEGIPAEKEGEKERLWKQWQRGEETAEARLTELYLAAVAELSLKLHREGCCIGDMVQEGTMLLLGLLRTEQREFRGEDWLLNEIRTGLEQWIREQKEQKMSDDSLVEQVRKLEAAVRQLSDDTEKKYSMEELSAYLDMEESQIRAVLRLTGENTEETDA